MGLNDAIWGWFYGHNILGLWFTTGTVALIYFIVPKETKQPLYGYTLALIAFWFLAFFYTAVGTHHILQSPVPEWLKTISVISLGRAADPGLRVHHQHLHDHARVVARRSTTRFRCASCVTGAALYLLVERPGLHAGAARLQPSSTSPTGPVAHAHLALLGFVAFTMLGLVYYIVPRILRLSALLRAARVDALVAHVRRVPRLLLRADRRRPRRRPAASRRASRSIQILPGIRPLWIGRAAAGTVDHLRRSTSSPTTSFRTLAPQADHRREVAATADDRARPRPTRVDEEDAAMKMTPRLIIIGGLAVVLTVVAFVVFLPVRVFKPADTLYVRPYTELEQQGRDLYVANGCMYCHSQFTRPGRRDALRARARPATSTTTSRTSSARCAPVPTSPTSASSAATSGRSSTCKDPRDAHAELDHAELQATCPTHRLEALVAYLNTLGNKQTASTDLMIPDEYVAAGRSRYALDRRELGQGPRHLREALPHLPRLRGQGRRPLRDDQQRAPRRPAADAVQEPAGRVRLLAHQRGRARHGHAAVEAVADRGRALARRAVRAERVHGHGPALHRRGRPARQVRQRRRTP